MWFVRLTFIPKRDERILTKTASLEKRDSVHLVLGFGDYRYYTFSIPLTLNLLGSVYNHGSRLFQNSVRHDVESD